MGWWMDEWMDGWMDGWTELQYIVEKSKIRLKNALMDRRKDVWIKQWMNEKMDDRMNGWMKNK